MVEIRKSKSVVLWSALAGGLLGANLATAKLAMWIIENGWPSSREAVAGMSNHFLGPFVLYPLACGLLPAVVIWAFWSSRHHDPNDPDAF